MSDELGLFFCENCGTTPYVGVPYAQKPDAPCPRCGFTGWIWEPTDEEVGT